jgi:hypothetical protein
MSTTIEELRQWFLEGVELGASHMIVVCDTYDHEDYPVYVKQVPTEQIIAGYQRVTPVTDVRAFVAEKYSGQNMQRTMEVYRLTDDIDEQMSAGELVKRF